MPCGQAEQLTPPAPKWPGVHASVGEAVGVAVGYAVGYAVGALVGEAVGYAVGALVGEAVGYAVGYAVGALVGDAVGYAVGYGVGMATHSVWPARPLVHMSRAHSSHSCQFALPWNLPIAHSQQLVDAAY